ncbi:hypothetical protein EZV62_003354 [Acer yangbiense]|uniref:DUF4220 domain-containing protein n=1 Tax=Acer yangbiense TaxID=1000413 RepID=A0A5C7IHA6_9ROSI|nr:hypothetical protein EZV62_003354 [Acer yangbiense]
MCRLKFSCEHLVYSKKRRTMMELYPSWLRKLWKEWDLRVMVLFSLTFQIFLIFLGNRRKYSNKLWIRIVVWSAYITADSVATFALGILSSNLIELYDKDHDVALSSLDANTQLSAFWAPFLILHLGGPDTITAYALEDNELWLRHLIGLVVQTGMAISIFLMSWTAASSLSILSLVMFLPGIIRYGERTWVLRSESIQQRRESSRSLSIDFIYRRLHIARQINSEEDALRFAEEILFISKLAFLDDKMVQSIRRYSFDTFKTMSPEEYGFKVIELELGMMYDLLYTKLPLLFTGRGIVLRMITFFLTCSVMVLFPVLVDKHKYSKVDLSITYLLIIVAVIHDIYAALLMVLSDTFAFWLIEHRNDPIVKTLNCFPLLKRQLSTSTRRWSNKMSQCSLLRFTSSKAKPKMSFKLLNKRIEMGKYWHCEVSKDLRELLFMYVKQKAEDVETSRGTSQWRPPFAELPSHRSIVQQLIKSLNKKNLGAIAGVIAVAMAPAGLDGGPRLSAGESIYEEFEFELSIIVWHIATEVWYYLDQQQFQTDFRQNCRMIKRVSRYMMYLLVERPFMLSVEDITDRISFKHIWKIAGKERIQLPSRADKISSNKAEACKRLLEKYPHISYNNREELVIYFAMELVRKVNHKSQTLEDRWEVIKNQWMEMLGYAARKCKGNEHAQQLRRGGELLTHVWLLLCHFGLTDHYTIERYDEIKSDEEE